MTSTCKDDERLVCPKDDASFLSRLTFSWFNPIAVLGFKRPLESNDLWYARKEDRCDTVFEQFDNNWTRSHLVDENEVNGNINYANGALTGVSFLPKHKFTKLPDKTRNVLKTIFATFWVYILGPSLLRFFSDLLMLVNPVILK